MSPPRILRALLLTCTGLLTGCMGFFEPASARIAMQCNASSAVAGEAVQCEAGLMDQYGQPFPVDGDVSYLWTVGDSDVATVDETGRVLTKAAGSTVVKASASWKDGFAAGQMPLKVIQPTAQSVVVTCEPTSILAGGTIQCTALTRNQRGQPLPVDGYLWATGNSAVAMVDETGKVFTKASGSTSVSAQVTVEGRTVTGRASLTVLQGPYASKVTVTCEPSSLVAGQTSQCTAITEDSVGKVLPVEKYLWSTSYASIATVDEAGKVLTLRQGSTSVSAQATWEGRTVTGRASLTVLEDTSPRLTGVTAVCASTSPLVGTTVQCAASARDQRGEDYPVTRYTWTSSNEAVAKVDEQGKVSVLGLGTTNVSASATERGITKEGRVTLTVKGPIMHQGPITVSETWRRANNPHVVTGTIVVGGLPTPTLSLESGVEVQFESGAALVIGTDAEHPGALISSGTESQPVRLTARSNTPQPGDWAGISFFRVSTSTSRLSYTTIEYAGAALPGTTPTPGVQSLNGALNIAYPYRTPEGYSSLVVSNVTVRKSKDYGVVLNGNLSPSSTRLLVHDNGKAGIAAAANAVGRIPADSQLSGNAIDEVLVWGGEVTQNQTWPRLGVPYRIFSLLDSQPAYVSVGASSRITLTLTAGTTLLMPAGSAFIVGLSTSGALIATGNANEPIQFVADTSSATPGFWSGLHFQTASTSTLSYVQVSHAGAKLNGILGGGAVNLYRDLGPFMTQSILHASSGCGVSVAPGVTTDFTRPEYGNVFVGLAGANQCGQ